MLAEWDDGYRENTRRTTRSTAMPVDRGGGLIAQMPHTPPAVARQHVAHRPPLQGRRGARGVENINRCAHKPSRYAAVSRLSASHRAPVGAQASHSASAKVQEHDAPLSTNTHRRLGSLQVNFNLIISFSFRIADCGISDVIQ